MNKISIIIPVLNEAAAISSCLEKLQSFRLAGHEVIVADGGSNDASPDLAKTGADRVISSARGRAIQMNTGAAIASGEVFLFLHADTSLPKETEQFLRSFSKNEEYWGWFTLRLSGKHPFFRVIESLMNWRSRLTGIATGDQAVFVSRNLYETSGGFPDIALMEDISYSGVLKSLVSPTPAALTVISSSRRWEKQGIVKTIFKMWWLRLRFHFGASPDILAREYG